MVLVKLTVIAYNFIGIVPVKMLGLNCNIYSSTSEHI